MKKEHTRFSWEEKRHYQLSYPNLTLMSGTKKKEKKIDEEYVKINRKRFNTIIRDVTAAIPLPQYQLTISLNSNAISKTSNELERKETEMYRLRHFIKGLFFQIKRSPYVHGKRYDARNPSKYPDIEFGAFPEKLLTNPHAHLLYKLPEEI